MVAMLRNRAVGKRSHGLAYVALALVAASYFLSTTFVAPSWRAAPSRSAQQASAGVVLRATGEYTGFVPDMQRRMLMNLVVTAVTAVPAVAILGGYIFYFYPQLGGGGGGVTTCGDINGAPVSLAGWLKTHRPGDRELVQGIKGEAYYIVTDEGDKIKDFAINAVCTHLGCVVPWVRSSNRTGACKLH